MAKTGIPEIDATFDTAGGGPITPASPAAAIGVIWDLLRGHERNTRVVKAIARSSAAWKAKKRRAGATLASLPQEGSPAYGILPADSWLQQLVGAAVLGFKGEHVSLGENLTWKVDRATLLRLATPSETRRYVPLATRAYLTHVIDVEWSNCWALSLIAQHEGRGRFDALNKNTDGAGLSVGLIQWAQSPGRLFELLDTIFSSDSARVKAARKAAFALSATDLALLLKHTKAAKGADGIHGRKAKTALKDDPDAGHSRIPDIDLLKTEWIERFRRALAAPALQGVQVARALKDQARDWAAMKKDDDLAQFASTYRARTFMLDLANQHGPVGNGTRPGARMIFRKAWKAIGPSHPGEDDIIGEVTKESLILLSHFFPGGKTGESKEVRAGRARREFFRTVSDTVFPTGAPPA